MMDLNEILPELLLGSCPRCADDVDQLKREHGITAVLNLQTEDDFRYWEIDWARLEARYRQSGITVCRVPVRDFDRDDLRERLPECARVLDELMRAGHRVYVHCSAGMNRSPSAVIAYLHWYEGRDLDEAVRHVTRRRSCDPYVDAIRQASEDRAKRQRGEGKPR